MRRYMRRNDLPDAERVRLDFVLSVFGPGMKEASLCARRFIASQRAKGRRLCGGLDAAFQRDPAYEDLCLVDDPAKLPDVVGGAGFGEFLHPQFIARHVRGGTFERLDPPPAVEGMDRTSLLFEGIDLCDPSGRYRIYGGSAFTMLVDERKLDGRPAPGCWEDLLDPRYRDMIVCGFNIDDVNEIPLVYLYRMFGEDGLAAFADNLAAPVDTLDMMRVTLRSHNRCAIMLVPHFFAVAAPHEPFLHEVWPRDGALLSPYYVLAKQLDDPRVHDILGFFFGDDLAATLAGRRMFPVRPVDRDRCVQAFGPDADPDPDGASDGVGGRRFAWVGWDWLLQRDIFDTMSRIDAVVTPRILDKHPELAHDIGRARWNG